MTEETFECRLQVVLEIDVGRYGRGDHQIIGWMVKDCEVLIGDLTQDVIDHIYDTDFLLDLSRWKNSSEEEVNE